MRMHMGHVALRVVDVDAYVDHITRSVGLQVLDRSGEAALLGTQASRHELQLIQDGQAGFDHIGLAIEDPDDFDPIVERALAAGGRIIDTDVEEPGCERSATVVGPGGVAYQLYVPAQRVPLTVQRHLSTSIRRLGHVTFFSNEADALVSFWTEGLGFRISDRATGFVWARCDAYHHTMAVGPHPAATVLHHHAWEIQDVTALTKHCDVNAMEGRPQMWGPVRHGPGFNIATYMLDAAGAVIEVYTDLLIIEDDENYVPVDWSDEPLALNLWGTMPSPEAMAAGLPVLTTAVGGAPHGVPA